MKVERERKKGGYTNGGGERPGSLNYLAASSERVGRGKKGEGKKKRTKKERIVAAAGPNDDLIFTSLPDDKSSYREKKGGKGKRGTVTSRPSPPPIRPHHWTARLPSPFHPPFLPATWSLDSGRMYMWPAEGKGKRNKRKEVIVGTAVRILSGRRSIFRP